MRLSLILSIASVMALAACADTPKTPATPVQANQAAPATADADQARPHHKACTGSRICTDSTDPSVSGGLASGLSNSTSNAGGGGPH